MSIDDLRQRLRDVPGAEHITMQVLTGRQVFSFNGRIVATDLNATDAEIDRAIRAAVDTPAVATILPQVNVVEKPKEQAMSITGLQSGAFQAKLAEMKKRLADRQSQGLAKVEDVVAQGEAKIEAATSAAAKQAQSEIDDALHEFAQYTNGGPV